jgi:hypothetical protein
MFALRVGRDSVGTLNSKLEVQEPIRSFDTLSDQFYPFFMQQGWPCSIPFVL